MTKLDVHFRLAKPLDETMIKNLADANAKYGIERITLDPAMDGLTIEYDATRLRRAEVEATLACAGIAVETA